MDHTLTIISIAGAVAVGAISPGPSFLMVARTAVAASRTSGLCAALGMGVGAMLFALAALFGLHALFSAVPWLYTILKILGGMYLAYLGFKIYRGANTPLALSDNANTGSLQPIRSFWLGLGTQVSNPKTAVVYASIFAALLPKAPDLFMLIALPIIVFFIETAWYAIAAVVLSSASPRATYLRYKKRIDQLAGGVMIFLGIKLLVSAKEI
jgi:threonine/homoserine/homoserine lactone efflux protein